MCTRARARATKFDVRRSLALNAYTATARAYVYVCARITRGGTVCTYAFIQRRAGVQRLVTCTCQNQYLASLGYDNAAACRAGPRACVYAYVCAGVWV